MARLLSALCLAVPLVLLLAPPPARAAAPGPGGVPAAWRIERRLIDVHTHVGSDPAHLARAIRIMDAAGIGLAVNLGNGTVTAAAGRPSAFQRTKEQAERLCPGRFLHSMILDYAGWDEPDFAARAARQIEEGHRLGAAGFKEYKRLGLNLKDGSGALIRIDDPRLDPVWARCGELDMPVSIHVGDPKAFWLPYEPANERWEELRDHPGWWFGDPSKYPAREELHAARNRVIERHPGTTFICVHFANNPEDVDAVDRWLDQYPNMVADLAARLPELGRHDTDRLQRLFVKHQDRILFGTDFMVYDEITLGSGGSGPPPTDEDALSFFAKHWRWLETADRDFPHMTPIQGNWTISAIALPPPVLRKIYFDNARRIFARSLPPPLLEAASSPHDFLPDGDPGKAVWRRARPVAIEQTSLDGVPRPELATEVRALWTSDSLYLLYRCPFTELTAYEPANPAQERDRLWEKDVVEAFIAPDAARPSRYREFEVAPNGEWVDLDVDRDAGRFDRTWDSRFRSAVHVDRQARCWTAELRIPLAALGDAPPHPGDTWRINLYRCDRAHDAFLAWNPTRARSFHQPERFGLLRFVPR